MFLFLLSFQSDIDESIVRQPCKQEPLDIPHKKAKLLDEKYMLDYQYQTLLLAQYHQHYNGFRPWAPLVPPPPPQSLAPKHIPHMPYTLPIQYLSQEPPVLQNPERVVRLSERERYEESYQPNVALAPRKLAAAANYTNGHAKTNGATGLGGNGGSGLRDSNRDELDAEKDEADANDGDGDEEEEERDEHDERRAHDMPMGIEIKKERSITPNEEAISPDGQMPSPSMAASAPAATSTTINPAPISPEGQSGSSNEITSSTSPVPVTKMHKPTESTVDLHHHSPKMSPPLGDSHHHIHHNHHHALLRSHHQPSDIKPPVIGTHCHHRHPEQHSISNHALSNGGHHNNLHQLNNHHYNHHHKLSGGADLHHIPNSEFELSTDTDDNDSMAGEADSSNNLSPLDIAIEALKETRPKDRDRVLHVIKMLMSENVQMSMRIEKLLRELQCKEEERLDLLQYKKHNERLKDTVSITNASNSVTTLRPIIDSRAVTPVALTPVAAITTTTIKSDVCMPETNDDITGSIPEITELENRTITIGGKNSETEVIRMPLKKSMRRSPEDSTIIIQTHRVQRNDESTMDNKAVVKYEKVSRSGYVERDKTPPLHNNGVVTTADAADTA